MIEEQAVVAGLDEPDHAWVEVLRQTACSSCSARSGCGSAALAKVLGAKRSLIRVRAPIDVQVGDQVVVGLDEHVMLSGSVLLYLLPLAGLFIFGGIASLSTFAFPEWVVVMLSFAGLLVGMLVTRRMTRGSAAASRYEAVILRHSGTQHVVIDSVFPA